MRPCGERNEDGAGVMSEKREVIADEDVAAFIGALNRVQRPVLYLLRATILGADRRISEGIKWNVPSFRTGEWFATTNVRGKGVRLILHLGAKVRPDAEVEIGDPDGLLQWLGKDRAMVTFADVADAKGKAKALKAVVKAWVGFV